MTECAYAGCTIHAQLGVKAQLLVIKNPSAIWVEISFQSAFGRYE
jgi:hypothetical protein